MYCKFFVGGIIEGVMGITSSLGISAYELNYHPFESYYENPKFQIQQMIEKIFIENSIKEMNRGGITNDKN